MTTRYVLTLCTALIVGGALITGSANALGKADEKTSKHAREAEQAENKWHASERLQHAQLSLSNHSPNGSVSVAASVPVAVPEPSTLLLGSSLLGVAVCGAFGSGRQLRHNLHDDI